MKRVCTKYDPSSKLFVTDVESVTLSEAGKVLSKANESKLRTMYRAIKEFFSSAGIDDLDTDNEDTTDVKESKTFSVADEGNALTAALLALYPRNRSTYDTYISARLVDFFPSEKLLVYQLNWEGEYYEAKYTLDTTGVATIAAGVPVTRKVTYVAKSSNPTIDPIIGAVESDIVTEPINLVESAVKADGTVLLKLISPGWGSSGYYPADVLKRDGPKVFKKGMHNLIDHPTALEEQQRPEGSIHNLGSVLTEDAKWLDHPTFGSGLYAAAKVTSDFAPKLNVIAPYIGMSIRAGGIAKPGEAEGKRGHIVESITSAKSVDYVTMPGRGGAIVDLMESLRVGNELPTSNESDHGMPVTEEEFRQLQESYSTLATQLRETQLRETRNTVNTHLTGMLGTDEFRQVPALTKTRVIQALTQGELPMLESGSIDLVTLSERATSMIKDELNYLTHALGTRGARIAGLGSSVPTGEDTSKLIESLDQDIAALNHI